MHTYGYVEEVKKKIIHISKNVPSELEDIFVDLIRGISRMTSYGDFDSLLPQLKSSIQETQIPSSPKHGF